MTSLWLDGHRGIPVDEFVPGSTYDAVIVGAGITGLAAGLLLARSGMTVAVLEARSVGAGTTGNTTAKLSLLQGTVLSALRRQYSQKIVNAYVEANREGQAWLLRHLQAGAVPFQRRDAYTFAVTEKGANRVRSELAVSNTAGLAVEEVADPGLPFATRAAIRLPGQAQFNPMDVLESLASDYRAHGGIIVEGVRVRDVTGGSRVSVSTDAGDVHAGRVVLATGTRTEGEPRFPARFQRRDDLVRRPVKDKDAAVRGLVRSLPITGGVFAQHSVDARDEVLGVPLGEVQNEA